MIRLIHKTFIVLLLTGIVTTVMPQLMYGQTENYTPELQKSLEQINDLLTNHHYRKAIEASKLLLKKHPKSPDVYMSVGLGYINLTSHPDSAVYFLKKGLDLMNDDELLEETGINLQLSLGKALQFMLKPDRAIEIYEKMLRRLSPADTTLMNEVSHEMEICESARVLIANPIAFNITNLGNKINSPYDDHSPLVTLKGDAIFFTSRRPGEGRTLLDDEQYPEKIWLSSTSDTTWHDAHNLKTFFRKNEHESAVSLSPNGKNLFLFKNDPDGKNLYVSTFVNNEWGVPKKLANTINSYENETHCSLSADESTLYFTSDMPGGLGGIDIYSVKKDINGNWGEPHNLGSAINTRYDEETPMIYLDGKTLYFASEGHNSMGQFDIFYSQMNADSTWNTPVNMGFPINTPGDDLFFVPTIDRKRAYYATKKFSDNYGGLDIYLIEFNQDFEGKLSVIEGKVNQSGQSKVVRLLVTRTDDNLLVGDYRPDPKTGEYTMFLETGHRYQMKEVRQMTTEEVVGDVVVLDEMAYTNKKQVLEMVKDVRMDPPLVSSATNRGALTKEMTSPPLEPSTPKIEILSSRPIGDSPSQMPIAMSDTLGYTIQLLALRKQPLKNYAIFKGLNKNLITEHYCSDGFFRYTYSVFNDKAGSMKEKDAVQQNGRFNDAFVRPMKQLNDMKVGKKQ